MLVSKKPGGPNTKPGETMQAYNAKRDLQWEQVEYTMLLAISRWPCRFHVVSGGRLAVKKL